jgi:hypothetical protein
MRALALALAAVLGAASPGAAGNASVFLNGANIDGATNQQFDNCTVVIDGQGNVRIEAKGYAVKTTAPLPPAAVAPAPRPVPAVAASDPRFVAPAKLMRRYFLAAEQSEPDGTQYDVAIFINAQWIREVKSSEGQVVMEVTRYLRPGPNKVLLAAQKRIQGDRRSTSRTTTLKVVIGAGNVGGDHVMIDEPQVEMTRTAAEVDDKTEEYVLEAR